MKLSCPGIRNHREAKSKLYVAAVMQISIIIPVFNQFHYTRQCLEHLEDDRKRGAEVIVIDNGSTDETAAGLKQFSGLKVIRNEQNRGCAPAWNQGVEAASGEWRTILNNDVLTTPGWLESQLQFARNHGVDIVSPAMREGPLNYSLPDYAREFTSSMKDAARPGFANGVSFTVNRRVFETSGKFDENFRIGVFEDADFFRRAKQAGFKLAITGSAFIHHFGSSTQKEIKRCDSKYEAENRDYFRRKWKLNWIKRRIEKTEVRTRLWFYRSRELAKHGHTVHERWHADSLHYY